MTTDTYSVIIGPNWSVVYINEHAAQKLDPLVHFLVLIECSRYVNVIILSR